jgi:hypothetical protein
VEKKRKEEFRCGKSINKDTNKNREFTIQEISVEFLSCIIIQFVVCKIRTIELSEEKTLKW